MATALEIITDAYRESNITAIGVTPNEAQQTEGLRRLNAVVSSALGFEIGEGLQDWMVGNTNIETDAAVHNENVWVRPPANSRLLINAGSAQTLYLPVNPSDGARMSVVDILGTLATYPVTLNGNGRNIEGADDVVLNTDDLNRTWFYRADLGDWKRVSQLGLADPMPFPAEHDDAFVTLLAMRLNPRYGRAISVETASWMERSLRSLRARYKQKVIVAAPIGVRYMSDIGPGSFWGRRSIGGLGIIG
jgi:hypothetical protein